jgi:hypothetical protein
MLPDCIAAPALAQRLQVATSTVHRWRTCGLSIRRSDGTTDYVRLDFRIFNRRVLIPLSGEERRDGTRVLGVREFIEALRHDPAWRPLPPEHSIPAASIPLPAEPSEYDTW